jgi:solute carrier family 35
MIVTAESLKAAERSEIILGVGSWMVCSVGMMLSNKLAVTVFPFVCTLTGLQCAFTLLALLVCVPRTLHFGSLWDVMRWSMVGPFFAGMLVTSLLALHHAPMTLVIVMRSLSPLVSLVLEQFFPNPLKVSRNMILSILMMLVGTSLYTLHMHHSQLTGLGWILLNMIFAVGDRLLQSLMLSRDQSPVDISKTGTTFLNNLFAILPMIFFAVWRDEITQVPAALPNLSNSDYGIIVASCVVGLGISYTGIWAQSLINATSFLVLVNANKFVIIFLEAFVFKSKVLTTLQIVASVVTIFGGIFYGMAREELERSKDTEKGTAAENDALLAKAA